MTADPWWVCISNTNCERRATQGLVDRGFEVWLPEVVREITIGRGASKTRACRKFPAAPGYLFTRHPNWQAWPEMVGVDGLRSVLCINFEPAMVSAKAIEQWRLDLMPLAVPVVEDAFRIGDVVVISDGPFLGYSAVLDRILPRGAVEVSLSVFGRSTGLQIDRAKLEAMV